MTSKPASKSRPRPRWRRRLLIGLLLLPVVYLLGTGPVLWSRTRMEDRQWRKATVYYVAPVMWLNFRLREPSLVEQAGLVDLLPTADDTAWYECLEGYWGLFGRETIHEAERVELMLKFRLSTDAAPTPRPQFAQTGKADGR